MIRLEGIGSRAELIIRLRVSEQSMGSMISMSYFRSYISDRITVTIFLIFSF